MSGTILIRGTVFPEVISILMLSKFLFCGPGDILNSSQFIRYFIEESTKLSYNFVSSARDAAYKQARRRQAAAGSTANLQTTSCIYGIDLMVSDLRGSQSPLTIHVPGHLSFLS